MRWHIVVGTTVGAALAALLIGLGVHPADLCVFVGPPGPGRGVVVDDRRQSGSRSCLEREMQSAVRTCRSD